MLYVTAAIALSFAIILFGTAVLLHKASKEKQAEEKKSEEMEQALSN
jgi:type II secretory pathway component PulJ